MIWLQNLKCHCFISFLKKNEKWKINPRCPLSLEDPKTREHREREHYFFSCRINFTVELVGLSTFSHRRWINFETRHVRRKVAFMMGGSGSQRVSQSHYESWILLWESSFSSFSRTLFDSKHYRLEDCGTSATKSKFRVCTIPLFQIQTPTASCKSVSFQVRMPSYLKRYFCKSRSVFGFNVSESKLEE